LKPQRLWDYYFFGTSLRYLQDARAGWPIHDRETTWCVLSNIREFLAYLDQFNLQVAARASYELATLHDKLQKTRKKAVLTEEQAGKLASIMEKIRPTLDAEIEGIVVYTLAPRRIDVSKLMSDVAFLLQPGVFAVIPEIARYDLQEAGKCIAYGRATAAAFHLLRATEAVLRAVCRASSVAESPPAMWGPMIQNLRANASFVGDPDNVPLLNHLDNIRSSFRNPTQHPEKVYDIEEVQDLWALCVDVINRMARHLPGH